MNRKKIITLTIFKYKTLIENEKHYRNNNSKLNCPSFIQLDCLSQT